MLARSAHLCAALLIALAISGPAAAQSGAPAPGSSITAAGPEQTPSQNPVGEPGAEPSATSGTGAIAVQLPRDLSPWGMFLSADIVVKAVMIGLAFASFVTWTIALAKSLEILAAKRRLRRELARLARTHSILDAGDTFKSRKGLAPLVHAAESVLA